MRVFGWPARLGLAAVAGLALIVAFAYFQPQKLVLNERVEETIPASPQPSLAQGATDSTSPSPSASQKLLASASLQSLEHQSSGTVFLIELPGGQRILRLENLATSNGPDMRVYLSITPASSDWYGYDRDYLDLGALKGNLGNQNYEVPAGVDLAKYRSAVIWCRRFMVGFAVADLRG